MKHSKIVVFLSLLLVAIMAFSSCSGSAVIPNGDQLNNAPEENGIELLDKESSSSSDKDAALKSAMTNNKSAISAAVKKWQDYVSFKQNDLGAAKQQIATDIINDDRYTITNQVKVGELFFVYAEKEVYNSAIEDEETFKRVLVYNLFSGNVETPMFDTGDYKDYSVSGREADYATYSFERQSGFSGFKVVKTQYTAQFDMSAATAVFTEYEVKTETTFYTAAVGAIKPASEGVEAWATSQKNGYYEVTIGDKVYAINSNGEILKTFDKGLQYPIPANADLELNGLKYYFESDYIYVLDKDFNYVSSYAYLDEGSQLFQYKQMLPNGNVLVQYVKLVEGDDEAFDFELVLPGIGEAKLDIAQYLYTPATGAVKELELGYLIDEIYDSENEYFAMKDEANFVAEVIKYTGGETFSQTVETTKLVFKGDFELVAELPEIIMNQTGMPTFVAKNQLIVTTTFADGETEYKVLVDRDGNYKLLPNVDNFTNTKFSFDSETYVYETNSKNEFEKPFEDCTVFGTYNGTTTLFKAEKSNYIKFYYYSESEGDYVTREVTAKGVVGSYGSLILLYLGEDNSGRDRYAWYDAYGHLVVNTDIGYIDNTVIQECEEGILLRVYHTSSDNPAKYYFVK